MSPHGEPLAPGPAFDRQFAEFLQRLRCQTLRRRDVLGVAAMSAASLIPPPLGGGTGMPLPLRALALRAAVQDAETFSFGLDANVTSLEPALSYDVTSNAVVCQISEGLLRFDATGQLQPLLAEAWEHPDPLTYVYTLRQGVTFHDGTPLTAADVVASIERVRDPAIASPMAWMYDAVERVEATDERTVTITLASPSALFQYVPAVTAGHVVSRAAIAQFGDDLGRNPVGTGPYRFVRWDSGSEIELERNPDYWQAGKPVFERVLFRVIEEGTTRVTALKTGEIQATAVVPPEQVAIVRGFPEVAVQEVVGYEILGIAFRTDTPPFDDLKVRQAVSQAIDVEAIVRNLVQESGVRAQATTVPPNMPGSAADRLDPLPYDLDAAKRLLAESSQPNGFAAQLIVDPNELRVAEAVYIQEALAALSIDVEVLQMPWEEYLNVWTSGEYEGMFYVWWVADFPDASGMLLPLFHSANVPPNPNIGYYQNARVDELLDASEKEQDAKRRLELLVEAQELIAADVPMLWISHPKVYWPMATAVTGYTLSPLWSWDAFTRDLHPA